MSNVQTMICLGLGKREPQRKSQRTNCFDVQYSAFVYMWEKVDEKWRDECASRGINYEPVKRYLQDPDFDMETTYLLRSIPRQTDPTTNNIISDPAASDMLRNNKDTFVFAPHLNCNIWPDFLALRPQVFIGNSPNATSGRDQAYIETYIQESAVRNSSEVGPRFRALQNGFSATDTEYRQTVLDQGPVDPEHLAGLTIYQR
ncbi:unnamed protein product [Aureobasidium vineae]|uniref:SRR1-like domain-containing protein n=1 Tax=Aureobasidium vineae TaxID=2773715 RepID=A0A9N8JT29_9PEZI|nr:unnamed protein product [Aureobasidium vineae]